MLKVSLLVCENCQKVLSLVAGTVCPKCQSALVKVTFVAVAAEQPLAPDEGYECHCNAEHAHMTYIAHEEGCPARLRR